MGQIFNENYINNIKYNPTVEEGIRYTECIHFSHSHL